MPDVLWWGRSQNVFQLLMSHWWCKRMFVSSVTPAVSCRPLARPPSPQAFVVRRLLEYTQLSEPDLPYGLLLVLGLLATELIRSWSLALTWGLNYRTGTRLRGAVLTMAFHKILRLRSLREKSMGQVRCWGIDQDFFILMNWTFRKVRSRYPRVLNGEEMKSERKRRWCPHIFNASIRYVSHTLPKFLLLFSLADQYVFEWRAAHVWSRCGGQPAGWRPPGGHSGNGIQLICTGADFSARLCRFHPLLPYHGEIFSSCSGLLFHWEFPL